MDKEGERIRDTTIAVTSAAVTGVDLLTGGAATAAVGAAGGVILTAGAAVVGVVAVGYGVKKVFDWLSS